MRSKASVCGILALVLALSSPATAAGRWDPDDARGSLDLRWIGAFDVAGGLTKITLVFWEPVTDRRLSDHLRIGYRDEIRGIWDTWRLEGRVGHLALNGFDDGWCGFEEGGPPMIRLSATTIRFYLPAFDGVRWGARTRTERCGGGLIDRTPWVPAV